MSAYQLEGSPVENEHAERPGGVRRAYYGELAETFLGAAGGGELAESMKEVAS